MRFARTPRTCLVVCLLSLALLPAVTARAQSVTRGPYLQRVTPTSVVVRWRTSVATNSEVRCGTSSSSLSSCATLGTSTTEHEVPLTGLSPATKYFYSVGTTTQVLSSGADHFFRTSPSVGSQGAVRIWAIGDFGTKNTNEQKVRDSYAAYTNQYQTYTNVWLMLGDNAYSSGTDAEYQSAIFSPTYAYQVFLRQTVPWPTIGNHDAASNSNPSLTIPYFQIFTLPKNAEAGGLASGTEKYYSFDYANIHFVCLDSQTATNRQPGSAMLTWLANDLASTSQNWIIAYWHHPPYSRGTHRSDSETELREMRQNVGPILEDHGVDLVLTGHSHNYERSFLIDSHYGTGSTFNPSTMLKDGGSGRPSDTGAYEKPTAGLAPHEGAVYAVVGASGNGCTGTGCGPVDYPAMYISIPGPTTIPPSGGTPLLGSLVLDIQGKRLDAKYLRETGAIQDTFTIIKGQSVPSFSINDVTVNEGTSGTTNAVFTVTLSPPATTTKRVGYQTVNGTATTADSDYTATSGTLTFTAGATSRTLNVPVRGDTKAEPNETFSVNLQNPESGTAIADGTGQATILDSTSSATFTLSVTKSGTGSGTVTSSPAGINCGSTCSASFNSGTVVNLTAAAGTGSSFAGWGGACSGTGACQVTMSAARSVSATFTLQGGGSTVFEKRVAASSDDAEQNVSTGGVGLTSSDLEMTLEGSVTNAVGIRFTGVNVPRGAAITNAWVRFKVDETGSSATSLSFKGQAADNAATFTTSANNVSSRPGTTASVSWSPAAWTAVGESGSAQQTPNLATIIQEIVNRSGWVSGNALALIVTGTGARVADSYDGDSAGAALLHVEYGASNQPPSVSAGTDKTITLPASVNLDGTVSDDGKPGPLTTTWSKFAGPGTVTFGNVNAVDTTASFSTSGVYTLRLTANDGAVSVFDDVVVTVNSSGGGPVTFEKRVTASSDDAEQDLSTGTVGITSSDLEMAVVGSVNQAIGIRFTGVNVPRNATIANAWVQFKVDETGSSATSLTFQGHDVDNAATFTTSSNNVGSRPRTAASVSWAPAAWTTVGQAGTAQRTPNLATIIQEIVNRSSWVSGNALALIVTGTGTRVAESYDGDAAGAALLHVEYQ